MTFEFDIDDVFGFEDVVFGVFGGVEFYLFWIDGVIDDYLSVFVKFFVLRNVYKYWLFVFAKRVDDVGVVF